MTATRVRGRWGRWLPWVIGAIVAALLLVGIVTVYLRLPAAQTVFAVSARTEVVEFRVGNPQAAAFGLRNALLVGADGGRTCLAEATVAPQYGARVQYARFGLDPVTITIDEAAARVTARPGVAGVVQPPVQLVLDPSNGGCPAPKLVRLPMYGGLEALGDETSFGDDPLSPRLVLLSGTIRMLVRAIDSGALRSVFRGEAEGGRREDGELFAVDQTVLPPGSVVRRAVGSKGEPADWWGFVDVVFGEADQRGLEVEASSHASSVEVELPAAVGSNGGAEDRRSLSVDIVQRWSNDPTLRLIALGWGGLSLVVGGVLAIWERSREWSRRRAG